MRTPPSIYRDVAKQSVWFSETNQRVLSIPEVWMPWLSDKGSLTSALIAYSSGQFRVNVLSERWAIPYVREALKLKQPLHMAARVREVELVCNEQVMVFARSIIPLSVFKKEPFTFQGMGSKPLGHLLFRDGRAKNRQRSLSQYCDHDGAIVFGRATPYDYHDGEILVSEFFVNPSLIE